VRAHSWTILGLPLVLFYVFAFVLSQAVFLVSSLYEPAGPAVLGPGPTLSNYENVLTDFYYLEAFGRSLLLSAAVSGIGLLLAYPMAFFIAQAKSRLGFIVLLIVVGRLFSNAVIRSLGWRIFLSSVGPVNEMLMQLGIITTPLPLMDNYVGALIGLIHALLPIYVVSLIPICQAVPRNLLRASTGLGASAWKTYWNIVFPLTRNGVIASMLLIFANSIGAFTTPVLLGGGRVLLLPILIREKVLMQLNWPIGAALATMLAALVLAISALVAWLGSTAPPGYRGPVVAKTT
jgi:putative spermidine/putrescine transport system permease protein